MLGWIYRAGYGSAFASPTVLPINYGWQWWVVLGFGAMSVFLFFFRREVSRDRQQVSADNFVLGCTPIVNLFPVISEPIPLSQTESEYCVVPDVRRPTTLEVYSIEEVVADVPHLDRALGEGLEVFRLAEVGGEGVDLHPLHLAEVVDADRGVEPAGVGQGDLGHLSSLVCSP